MATNFYGSPIHAAAAADDEDETLTVVNTLLPRFPLLSISLHLFADDMITEKHF